MAMLNNQRVYLIYILKIVIFHIVMCVSPLLGELLLSYGKYENQSEAILAPPW